MRENPYFLNIFNFGQFWPAEINKKKSRPVEISNPVRGASAPSHVKYIPKINKMGGRT